LIQFFLNFNGTVVGVAGGVLKIAVILN